MKLKMKTMTTLLIAIFMISTIAVIVPITAKPPTSRINYIQTQFQWRGHMNQFGSWTYPPMVGGSGTDVRLTEDVLHCWMGYSPDVFGKPRGMSHVYVDDGTGHWVLHEGKMSYMYPKIYGSYRAVNYFRGYMEFSGTPSTSTFVRGALYQWCYIMKPQKEPVKDVLPYAEWDPVMNAWLVGFSVYIQDPLTPSPPHSLAFPGPLTSFPRPIPANNFNPLGL